MKSVWSLPGLSRRWAMPRGFMRNRFAGAPSVPALAQIVDGCADSYTEPKPPWRGRKLAYIERVAGGPNDVRLVSAADKLSNVRETIHDLRVHGDAVFEKFHGKKEGTLWYCRALVGVFRKARTNALIDELDRAVTELESLAG